LRGVDLRPAAHEVPHFAEHGEEPVDPDGTLPWEKRLRSWLNARGFDVLHLQFAEAAAEFDERCMQFHHVRGGKTARGTNHDTVWFGRKMVHDPHPSRVGLELDVYPQFLMLFVRR
jgi:hypothetical protein